MSEDEEKKGGATVRTATQNGNVTIISTGRSPTERPWAPTVMGTMPPLVDANPSNVVRGATMPNANTTIISTRMPENGAALPPMQGGPALSASEMQTLGMPGRAPNESLLPARAPTRAAYLQEAASEGVSQIDIEALRKQIAADIDSFGRTAALPQSERVSEPEPQPEPQPEPAAPHVLNREEWSQRNAEAAAAAVKLRDGALKRMVAYADPNVPKRKRQTDAEAFADPNAYEIMSVDAMSANRRLPWD